MRKINKWVFDHKGFTCEINQHGMEVINPPYGIWCGYIIIKRDQLPEDFTKLLVRSKKTSWVSMPRRWDDYSISGIFEFHGGMTYYEVMRDQFSGEKVAIKAGFDCNHAWDEPGSFDEEILKRMLEESVDAFIDKFPNYLVWDKTNGGYIKPKTPSH